MASRLRFVLGQLGAKPDARNALALLLDAPDLDAEAAGGTARPQRWRTLDQRSWRTGDVAAPQPWQAAARAAGSVTVWRSFQAGPLSQWLWVQWSPMASADGASQALAAAEDPALGLSSRRTAVDSVSVQRVQPPVVAGADDITATQEQTTGPDPVLTLRCTAGSHLVLLCASGGGWTWPALAALAELQLRRLPRPTRPSAGQP